MANYEEHFNTDNGGWEYYNYWGGPYPATWSSDDGGSIYGNWQGYRYSKSILGIMPPGCTISYRIRSRVDLMCGYYKGRLRVSDGINTEIKTLPSSYNYYDDSFVLSNSYVNPTIYFETPASWEYFEPFGLSFIAMTGLPEIESTVLGIGRKQRGAYVPGGVSCGNHKRNRK